MVPSSRVRCSPTNEKGAKSIGLSDLEETVATARSSPPPTDNSASVISLKQQQHKAHLFVSYASEDRLFAEWLTLRLTAEGYKVWCDRTKLLGGESYPLNIDDAIKTSTFRILALLSKHSVHKANPVKERTLALNIGKERKIDFLIPLNVDGLKATEIDWMTNDLTFIPFHEGWAVGLTRLLKKLHQIDTPRNPLGARQIVSDWVGGENDLVLKSETIWSNIFPITELPEQIVRYHVEDQTRLEQVTNDWAFFQPMERENRPSQEVWALNSPIGNSPDFVSRRENINWKDHDTWGRVRPFAIFTYLLRRNLEVHCIKKGMKASDRGDIYFPSGLLLDNRLKFPRYDGKYVSVKVVGERTFKVAGDTTEKRFYHLSPRFRPLMGRFGFPGCQINLGIVWTNLSGAEDPQGKSNRRRKKLTRSWWNYQWLSRITAISFWISDGQDTCRMIETDHGNLEISMVPLKTTCPVGIDEEELGPQEEPEEEEILDDVDDREDEK